LPGTEKRLCEVYDAWDCADESDPRSRITVDHVMNISSGLEWREDWRSGSTTNDVFRAFPNVVDFTLSRQAVTEPGTEMRYSTGDPSLLTGVLQDATGRTASAFAQEEIFAPLGLPALPWASDAQGRTTTYAGLQATALEYAKLGFLYLRRGEWDGEQIVPAEWVARTTQPVDRCAGVYRYLWHINAPIRLGVADPACTEIIGCPPLAVADLPADAYFAEGVLGQFIFVIPSQDLVVVRLAQDDAGSEHWDEWAREFLLRLLAAAEIQPS
jgi:CubicO group peptidase (beta-lactamase class C family)